VPPGTVPLFIATRNPGKALEIAEMLSGTPFFVVGPDLMPNLQAPVEDGATFDANARKKAIHYSRELPPEYVILADDSGLEIEALDGWPGVRSARIGGPNANDTDRTREVLRRMEKLPWERRDAVFRCVIAIARRHHGVLATFEGDAAGRIAFEPDGTDGFGYDPVFYYLPAEMTFSAMTPVEKNHVSHRGQALERAVGWLREWAAAPAAPPVNPAKKRKVAYGQIRDGNAATDMLGSPNAGATSSGETSSSPKRKR
jgi:XTP/dITP diphosphohydrolase